MNRNVENWLITITVCCLMATFFTLMVMFDAFAATVLLGAAFGTLVFVVHLMVLQCRCEIDEKKERESARGR